MLTESSRLSSAIGFKSDQTPSVDMLKRFEYTHSWENARMFDLTIPTLLFGSVIATLYGAVFHLWRGGGLGRFILYLILGWLGFWVGHLLANQFGWTFFNLGALNLGLATISSLLFLLVGHWLSLVEVPKK
jgi:hypothetical protein